MTLPGSFRPPKLEIIVGNGEFWYLLFVVVSATEAIMLFNGLISRSVQLERQQGYAIAPLGYFRGTKLAYYGFASDYTLELVAGCTKPIGYKKIMARVQTLQSRQLQIL